CARSVAYLRIRFLTCSAAPCIWGTWPPNPSWRFPAVLLERGQRLRDRGGGRPRRAGHDRVGGYGNVPVTNRDCPASGREERLVEDAVHGSGGEREKWERRPRAGPDRG